MRVTNKLLAESNVFSRFRNQSEKWKNLTRFIPLSKYKKNISAFFLYERYKVMKNLYLHCDQHTTDKSNKRYGPQLKNKFNRSTKKIIAKLFSF